MKTELARLLAVTFMATTAGGLSYPVVAAQSISGSTGATSTSKPPQQPKPHPGQVVLDNLADTLGRELSQSEANEIKLALDAAKEKIQAANDKLIGDLSSAFGLSADKVKEILKTRAPLVETLSKLVGHKLTGEEIALMKAALEARFKAIKATQDELIATIVSITGLTNDEVAESLQLLPPPKPADKPSYKPSDKPADKPSEKPDCKPGGQQNGQQGSKPGGKPGGQQSGAQGGQQSSQRR